MHYQLLTSEFTGATLSTPNRVVLPPLVSWLSGEGGSVRDRHIEHYHGLRGPGLMIVEATAVAPEGRLAATQLGAFSDAQLEGLTQLAETLSADGAVPGIQLHHAGGKTTPEKNYRHSIPVPSIMPDSPEGAYELDEAEIRRIIEAFAAAAERVARAGFRYVELHGAHGYLGTQFLSRALNHRRDRWGGDVVARARFLTELTAHVRARLESVRGELGTHDHPLVLGMRLGLTDGTADGLPLADGLAAAEAVCDAGVQVLHISHAGGSLAALDPDSRWAPTLQAAARVRRELGDRVPVIGVGELFEPSQAERALQFGMADLTAIGRGLLADPGWAVKTLTGRDNEIERCHECRPKCYHYTEPQRCPARKRLEARRG